MNWPLLIKQTRERLGETQEQFAKRFAVTTNTVSRWETGTYQVSLDAVDWLLQYAESREVKCCPRCGGKGIVLEESQEADKAVEGDKP
ncbi:helix-turn-helix domain-containing protein [Mycolicibacterium sp. PDY-3]|uniref:helix-turn-helix domain-containing protein n=1 Tax=Mycolicibacterium sp. PDY-3 TaxID=3376069 RepID=UPI0037B7EBA4